MNEPIWRINPYRGEAKRLSRELGLSLSAAQVLVNRKIYQPEEAHKFLYGGLDDLYDPFLMRDMRKAVSRIKKAIADREKIFIFGDYDADGVLSVVILLKALRKLGAKVNYFIPNRLENGYGIKEEYLTMVKASQASLVISADCGIKATKFLKVTKEAGIDVIITDHHHPGTEPLQAFAVLNPILDDSGYPEKRLTGVGVVFKLIQALFACNQIISGFDDYLKLVSLGTIADAAELRGENRLLVKSGLEGLENASSPSLKSLLEVCGLGQGQRKIYESDVALRIVPRINAAGRMGMAELAVELFFTHSRAKTKSIANILDELNSKRQKIEDKVYECALRFIRKKGLAQKYKILVIGCRKWHRGVIGIVASRIKDTFYRPVLLVSYEDSKGYGSGRSISEISLIDCLNKHKEFFINFGGHEFAVGFEIEREKVCELKKALNQFAELKINEDDLRKKIYIDAKINFSELDSSLIEFHSLLSPFGAGNPTPLYLTLKAEILNEPQKIEGKHLKLLLKQEGKVFEAFGWERADWEEKLREGNRVDLVYSFQPGDYFGEKNVTLYLEDLRMSE